jgi:acyl-CoA synthetase (AMP-forming)/AMP-acid ligase II
MDAKHILTASWGTPLQGLLEGSARQYPDKIAVICGEVRASYTLLNTLANRFCGALRDHGLQKGDIVAILHENSLNFIAAYFGALKAGAVVAPLNTDLKPNGLQPILLELLPKAIIASARQTEKLESCSEEVFARTAVLLSDGDSSARNNRFDLVSIRHIASYPSTDFDPVRTISENDIACIIYTSGSTGKAKGVMLTHGNIVANTRSICDCLRLTERDIQMVVLPFSYVFGLSLLHTHIAVGGTLVINNLFCFTGGMLEQMKTEMVTGFSGVPSTYAFLLHRSPLVAFRDSLPCLRYCSQAGGHMTRKVKLELRRALPDHTNIIIMYGATEASARLTWLDPRYYFEKTGSIGREIPGVTIKTLDETGGEVRPGEIGELVASGPNIMLGYYLDPVSTSRVLDVHGYHTGDLGYRDGEGFLYVTGRRDNQMKVGGYRVDPQEIEDVIMDSGLVVEAAVVGMPDDLQSTVIEALIVPVIVTDGQEELFVHCARCLPRYKVPQHFFVIAELPKNGNGKIDRRQCAEMISHLQARQRTAVESRSIHA